MVFSVKILLDEDIQTAMADALRQKGINTIHIQELNRKGLTDLEQLEYATETERVLITYNVKDFVLLHNSFVKTGREHFGIIVSKQLSISECLQKILEFLHANSQNSLNNQLFFL